MCHHKQLQKSSTPSNHICVCVCWLNMKRVFSSFDLRHSFHNISQLDPRLIQVFILKSNFAKFATSNFTKTKMATTTSEVLRCLFPFDSKSVVFISPFATDERRFAWTLKPSVASLTGREKWTIIDCLLVGRRSYAEPCICHTAHAWGPVNVTAISIKMDWTMDGWFGITKWQNEDIDNDVEE